MKKIFLILFAAIIFVPLLSAQDIITLKNGDDIQAIAQEYDLFIISKSNDSEMATFLRKNDALLYDQFQRGIAYRKKGRELVTAGLIVTGTGMVLFYVGLDQHYKNKNSNLAIFMMYPGMVLSIVGPCVILTSIPFYATGGKLKRNAVESYENKHFINRTSHQPSLNLNLYGNGIGLALKF